MANPSITGRIKSVNIRSKDSLASKYGQGVTSIKGKQITTSWQTKSEVIELVDIRDALRFVSLTYSKRVYGPRGLDL